MTLRTTARASRGGGRNGLGQERVSSRASWQAGLPALNELTRALAFFPTPAISNGFRMPTSKLTRSLQDVVHVHGS